MAKLFDAMLELGLRTDVVTKALESKAWDHSKRGIEEWYLYLRRYRRFLSRTLHEVEFYVKLYNYLVDQLEDHPNGDVDTG